MSSGPAAFINREVELRHRVSVAVLLSGPEPQGDIAKLNAFWKQNVKTSILQHDTHGLEHWTEKFGNILGAYINYQRRRQTTHPDAYQDDQTCANCLFELLTFVFDVCEVAIDDLAEKNKNHWKAAPTDEEVQENAQFYKDRHLLPCDPSQESKSQTRAASSPSPSMHEEHENEENKEQFKPKPATSVSLSSPHLSYSSTSNLNLQSPQFRWNRPSIILTRIEDKKLLDTNDRSYFEKKWVEWCDGVLMGDELPSKLSATNIESVDLKGKSALTISFRERPKLDILDSFVKVLSRRIVGCRVFVYQENYSPPWRSPRSRAFSRKMFCDENLDKTETEKRDLSSRRFVGQSSSYRTPPAFLPPYEKRTRLIPRRDSNLEMKIHELERQIGNLSDLTKSFDENEASENTFKFLKLESKIDHLTRIVMKQAEWIQNLMS